MAAQLRDQGLRQQQAVRRDLAQGVQREAIAQAFQQRVYFFRVAGVGAVLGAIGDRVAQCRVQDVVVQRVRAEWRMRSRRGDGVQKTQVIGGGLAQADAAKAGLLNGRNLFACCIEEFKAGGQRMRRTAFQADTGSGGLASIGPQAQTADLRWNEGNALAHGRVIAQQLDDQLEGAIQQGGMQVSGAEFGFQAAGGLQHGQHAGVRFLPAMRHRAEGGAVIQAHGTGQRIVRVASEVGGAGGQGQQILVQTRQAGFTQQAAAGVLHPGLRAIGVLGGDAEAAIGIVQQEARQFAG